MSVLFEEDPGNACAAFTSEEIAELREIARIHEDAGNTLTKLTAWVGSKVEGVAGAVISEPLRRRFSDLVESALNDAFTMAKWSSSGNTAEGWLGDTKRWASGEVWHRWASAATGALGGFFGLPGAIIELPFTTTLILRSIIEVAEAHGLDLDDPAIRAQCLQVFALGGPSVRDDDADTGLWATRAAFGGAQAAELIPKIAARFGITASESIMARAVPFLGSAVGSAMNASFTSFYQSMAHVHFRLLRLEEKYPPDDVHACFERVVAQHHARAEAGRASAEARHQRRRES